jgi:hypothetical protein
MYGKLKPRVRNWAAGIFAKLHNRFVEYNELQQMHAIDDYLRVQNLRRYEEDRFRKLYCGPRL